VIGWSVAVLVLLASWIVVLRQRAAFRAQLHRLAEQLDHLANGRAPEPSPYEDINYGMRQVAERIEEVRREQTAEAANLQTILASMAEGVIVVDRHHKIRMVNPSLLRILELPGDPTGHSILRAVRDVHFEEIVSTTIATNKPQSSEVSIGRGKTPRSFTLTAAPMRGASGEQNVLLICHDITRLKQLEDVRREFVANVSHELRTPLAIFQGYLENLLDNPGLPEPELVNTLEILKKHSTRLNALVEDLLIIARLESRKLKLNIEPIEPCGLVKDMVSEWKLRAGKKSIQFTGSCEGDAPEFEADAFRIEQVLNNLIENALKYTESGGQIDLRAKASPFGIEFTVADTGIGIGPQDLPHIFERFYRADKARSREQGGTGLGLSIVKHIVQMHRGTVDAESTYGKGTTIILRLPLTQPFETPSAPEPGRQVEAEVNAHQN
jgi:two-component system phosphate regulon sensor histidine kinase PhoR